MSSDPASWTIYVLIVFVILIANGLVSASLNALDCVDRNKLNEILEDEPNNKRVELIHNFIKKPSKYQYPDRIFMYSMAIIAIVVFNFGFYNRLNTYRFLPIIANVVFATIYFAIADIFPKKLAAQSADSYAIRLIKMQRFIYVVLFPITKLCLGVANLFLLVMRKDIDVDDAQFSEDHVRSMLDKGQESGDLKEEGRRMIDSIFEFDDLLAYEIMTPRTDVFMIDLQDDKDEYFEELMELRHSRVPICDGDTDNIIGLLLVKDYLLKGASSGFNNINIKEIMREPYLVPETKNIDSLFVELQKTKQHIAILIDEYGGFSGIVSIEDIIEQIVGDIDDEFDDEDRIIEKVSDSEYIVDGNVYLDDLDKETGIELESENSETVGGFIIDYIGEIPKENSTYKPIEYGNITFQILEVKDRRIEKVRITIEENDKYSEKEDNLDE